MSGTKPRVFVGSSSEAKTLAEAFCSVLSDRATMTPWWDAPEFSNGVSTMESLMSAVDFYDVGIFVFSPDDAIESRGKKGYSARDNVLFEYGMFLGKLGRNATFAFIHELPDAKKKVRVPSDLAGIHLDRFSSGLDPRELNASIRKATEGIRDKLKCRQLTLRLMRGWGIEDNTFTALIPADRLADYHDYLETNDLVLVLRAQNTDVNLEDDPKVVLGKPRRVGAYSSDITLSVKSDELIGTAKPGTIIEAHVMLIPQAANISKARIVQNLLDLGGKIVQSAARTKD